MLKSRKQFPPGGWMIFYDDPKVQVPMEGKSFHQAVAAMWLFRRNNPSLGLSTDTADISMELDEWTCQRLKQDKRLCHPKTGGSDAILARLALISPKSRTKTSKPVVSPLPSVAKPKVGVAQLVAGLRKHVAGAKLLAEWFGDDSGPVPQEHANVRAATCAVCPRNSQSPTLLNKIKAIAGPAINRLLGVKKQVQLTVPNESKLGVCEVCDCWLATKVWVQLKKLINDTDEATEVAFPENCWYLKEKALYVPTFYHSGDLGDVIYGLPTIAKLGGGKLLLGPDMGIDPIQVPRDPMTPKKVAMIKPLIECQPYVTAVEFAESAEGADHNINAFRPLMWEEWKKDELKAIRTSLMDYQLMTFGQTWDSNLIPWLSVPSFLPGLVPHRWPIVCHRSARYRNPAFPWQMIVDAYGGKMLFVGLESEHREFCNDFGEIAFAQVTDFLQLARIIASSALFIGNQSLPYAIAEGLKVATMQETSIEHPNCLFERPNARFISNNLFDHEFLSSHTAVPAQGMARNMGVTPFPVCMYQAECNVRQTERLADFCKELDGTLVRVFSGPQDLNLGKAKLSNLAFRHVLDEMKGEPFIWLEADASPLKPYWAHDLTKAFQKLEGKQFLLSSDTNPPEDMIGGIGVYGPRAGDIIPTGDTMPGTRWANWDGWLIDHVPHLIARSPLVQHSYGIYENNKVISWHQFPRDLGMLREEAVIFHKDQHQTLLP